MEHCFFVYIALLSAMAVYCNAVRLNCFDGYSVRVRTVHRQKAARLCAPNQVCMKSEGMFNYSTTVFGHEIYDSNPIEIWKCVNSSSTSFHSAPSLSCSDLSSDLRRQHWDTLNKSANDFEISSCNIIYCDWDLCNSGDISVIEAEKLNRTSTLNNATMNPDVSGNMSSQSSTEVQGSMNPKISTPGQSSTNSKQSSSEASSTDTNTASSHTHLTLVTTLKLPATTSGCTSPLGGFLIQSFLVVIAHTAALLYIQH